MMKNTKFYINNHAIVPGVIYSLASLGIGLLLYSLVHSFCNKYHTVYIIIFLIFIITLHISKVKVKLILLLIKCFYLIIKYIILLKDFFVDKPFRLFYMTSTISLMVIFYFIFQIPKFTFVGFDLSESISIDTENTLALTIVATFIPFIFAALTYAKTHLASLLPSKIVNTCFDKGFIFASLLLGATYIVSATTPMLKFNNPENKIFQILLIIVTFISTAAFVWDSLRLANRNRALKYFSLMESKKLKYLFIKDAPQLSIDGMKLYKFLRYHLLGIVPLTLNNKFGTTTPSQEIFTTAKLVIDKLFSVLNRSLDENDPIDDFEFEFNEIAKYVSIYYECRMSYIYQYEEKVNEYFFPQLSQLIEICRQEKSEKYLDSLTKPIKIMLLSACKGYEANGMTMISSPIVSSWIYFLRDLVYKTSNVKYSSFPLTIISIIGDVTCIEIDFQTANDSNINIIKNIGKAFSKSELIWHKNFVQQTFYQFNKVIIAYVYKWIKNPIDDDHFIEGLWCNAYLETLRELFINADKIDFSYNDPLSPISNSLNHDSLLWSYYSASQILTDKKNLDSINKLMPEWAPLAGDYRVWKRLSELKSIHSIFITLLSKDSYKYVIHKTQILQSIVELFYIDFCCINNTGQDDFYYEWQKEITFQYQNIFDKYVNLLNDEDRIISDNELIEYLIGIPAIALTYINEKNENFANAIITKFINILLDNFLEKNDEQEQRLEFNRSVRQYLLLISSWLNQTKILPDQKNKIEELLKEYPFQASASQVRFSSYNYQFGLPTYQNMGDKIWWLFPSNFWPDNVIQYKIENYLMKYDELINYAKIYSLEPINDIDDDKFE